ncbi:HAD-IA family hydrolase [Brevibacillus choshinensis]|uniref:HAD-IA family hydrolase n=1 Tax=Brevibacillus choshinensis TaxID=54911 RepID=A0ABX7FRZ7_BRECH|nr:HAD-IA family hydrolase [Brevibacillus choshinensis]QRG68876.1 HAD-IA family hydrolase [Brevibacillus choshinensis]
MIKGIVFDFDGLILDTETVWYHSFREALEQYRLELTLETFASFVGTHGAAFDQHLMKVAGNQQKMEDIKRIANEIHQDKIRSVQAREGVRDYLEAAVDLGLRIGLASSSSREWVERFLRQLQLLSYFEVIKTADDVVRVKPDPELYVQAVHALRLQSDEVLAFEDSAAGAKAAKAAGLHCVIVPNPVTMDLIFENYDLRIESMAQHSLTHVLAKLDGQWSADSRGSF